MTRAAAATATAAARRRRWRALLPVAALVALLAVLATLQYRWTGELGRAEEERTRSSLTRAAAGLAADFDRELGRVFFHFLQPSAAEVESGLARRVAAWRAQPAYPELLRQLLLVEWQPGNPAGTGYPGGGLTLRALDEAHAAWRPVSWPAELLPLRRQMEAARERGGWGLPFVDDVPALVVPLWQRGDGDRRLQGRGSDGPRTLAVLWLDTATLRDRVLPALVDRHLGSEADYRVEVRDAAGRAIFAQGPAVAGSEPDVVMPLFRLPLAERFARHHAEHHGGARLRVPVPGPPGEEGSPRGRWLLSITHPAGSLASAVAQARWRNLAVSSLVLGLLAIAVGFVLVTARRAEALARRQIELVAGVSHELLTPVAAVRSAGENLAAGVVTDPERVREYGELIVREGRRLGNLVEQVLTWAGLQARAGLPQRGDAASPQVVDVGSVVNAVVASCAEEAARTGVALESAVAAGLPPVEGDRDALERALRNLVENALRHGGSGGWVGVGARLETGDRGAPRLVLSVEDRGRGLAAADLPHLFEPFFRGSGAEVPGSGLGLALARQIAEAHGGRVGATRAVPYGARFTLELPAATEPAAAAQHGAHPPAVPAASPVAGEAGELPGSAR